MKKKERRKKKRERKEGRKTESKREGKGKKVLSSSEGVVPLQGSPEKVPQQRRGGPLQGSPEEHGVGAP